MSLPVVAAFLTLVGYSVNDTVVIFDRIRENLRAKGGTVTSLPELINTSMNQTLSRTILTSLLTWIVCVFLFALGGPALRDFSFVMVVGIIVGTYSSIYIASPFLVVWLEWLGERAKNKLPPEPPKAVAKKVRAAKA
jgi:preprotein translocase SecF subunit